MKILVVDDELDICEILQYNLETEGFEVTTACSAEEALELPLHDYSLILLDVMMGEMSGFQMARRLKENPTTAHIPIIFITALDDWINAVMRIPVSTPITRFLVMAARILRRRSPANFSKPSDIVFIPNKNSASEPTSDKMLIINSIVK